MVEATHERIISEPASQLRAKYMIETSEVTELIMMDDPKLRFINASWYYPHAEPVTDAIA